MPSLANPLPLRDLSDAFDARVGATYVQGRVGLVSTLAFQSDPLRGSEPAALTPPAGGRGGAAHRNEVGAIRWPSCATTSLRECAGGCRRARHPPSKIYPTPGTRDDGTPKRPMNAFILFSNEKRSELAELNPTL